MISQTKVQTIKNANDGISIIQTAEGALQEQTNILQRMRELALQAKNDSNDRKVLGKEFNAMSDELTRIAQSTNLNGKQLLDGTAGVMTFQVGSNSLITIDTSTKFDAASLFVASGQIGLVHTDAPSAVSAEIKINTAINAIDQALSTINATRADLGTAQNRLTPTLSNLQNINENASAALGRVQDTDFAVETADLTKQQTLKQASSSVLTQPDLLPADVLKKLQ